VGLSDLRFYISNLEFLNADGEAVHIHLDQNEFQYAGVAGWVGMIDLTGSNTGSCQSTAISFSEGTERTNDSITGKSYGDDVVAVRFDVGVSQALMQEVISNSTAEAAPSPLNEMYWSWVTGYRHFVFNMTASDGVESGEGYLHIGSRDCAAADGELALQAQDSCGFVNTPQVYLEGIDLDRDVIAVDLAALFDGVDFVAPVYDPKTFEVIGEQVGVECHSSPLQPHCVSIFEQMGIDLERGTSSAEDNRIFSLY